MISDVTPPEQRGRAYGFHRAMDHTGAIVGPLLAVLVLQGFGFSLRQAFLFAVVPGVIGVALILVFLREAPRVPKTKADRGAAPPLPLPKKFWEAIAAIALFSLANSSDAFLLLQAHRAGISTAMLPLLWAAHHVIKSLFSTAAGALSDRIDRRYLLVSGWLSYAVIYLIFPHATTLTFFFVLFVVYAIPFTLAEGAERAWIADLVAPEARGRSFGIFHLTNGVCVLGGTILFGVIYEKVSVEAAFRTGAILAVAASLLVVFFWRSTERRDAAG